MLQMILLRMWREWRLMSILLVGMALVIAFLALGPLYVQAIAASEFESQLDRARAFDLRVDMTNSLPISPDIRETITAEIGDRITAARPYISSGQNCGFVYNPDNPDVYGRPTNTSGCYLAYAYPEFDSVFAVVAGEAPAPRSDDDAPLQGVITATMQADTGWELGEIIVYGEDAESAVPVEIVGIVEPTLPRDDPFWVGQTIFEQFIFYFTAIDSRMESSFIVHPDDYVAYITPAQTATFHRWRVTIDRTSLSVEEVSTLEAQMRALSDAVLTDFPEMLIRSTFDDLLRTFRESISTTQQPIIFLSALMLVPMLYSMVTITSLVQEQQKNTWALFASRGGSRLQLVAIQFVTILFLNGIAVLVAPLAAVGLLYVLTVIGPQAAIIDASHVGGMNETAWVLTAIAALTLQVTLIIPAWQGANESLLYLRREASRPVTKPLWTRFFLDFVLIGAGVALLLRLYNLTTGESPATLLQDPASLMRTLAESDITTLLGDPFSLAAPAFLLTGLTLLWMRLFPLLVGFIGRANNGNEGLLLRLAFWNVERDPGHYTRLVLLLIGTLAMGTASLVLSATRDAGAWDIARAGVGADAAVTIDAAFSDIVWDDIPGVAAATSVLLVAPQTPRDSLMIGIDTANVPADAGEFAEIASFISVENYNSGGQALPRDLEAVALDLYADLPEDGVTDIRTLVSITLTDSAGRSFDVPMETDDPSRLQRFMTYRADLPNTTSLPLILRGFIFETEQSQVGILRHTVYLDNLRGYDAEGNEQLIFRFEPDTVEDWTWSSFSAQGLPSTTLAANPETVSEGETSLSVRYLSRRNGGAARLPELILRETTPQPIPVIVSPELARLIGQRNRLGRPVRVGESVSGLFVVQDDLQGPLDFTVEMVIAGIRESSGIARDAELFLFADQNLLMQQINNNGGLQLGIRADTAWLTLEAREPATATLDALENTAGIASVDYAWDRYQAFLREPLPNAISGILFAGFWVTLLLTLLDFGFYLAVTVRQRAPSFATLQALGWEGGRLTQLLLIEQTLFVIPALFVGIVVGLLLSALIVPFLLLSGSQALQVPILSVSVLVLVLVIAFVGILRLVTIFLARLDVTRVMRFGE